MEGMSALARSHQLGRGRFVAATQQNHAIDGIGANRLLDVHRHQVAEHHRRGPHVGLAERNGREFEWEAARRPHAALDSLGDFAEMRVAARQLAPGVANPDDGLVLEDRPRVSPRPRAMEETEFILAPEPILTSKFTIFIHERLITPRPEIIRASAAGKDGWFPAGVASLFRKSPFERTVDYGVARKIPNHCSREAATGALAQGGADRRNPG